MYKQLLALIAITTFCSNLVSQNLADIFISVDTLYLPGAGIGDLAVIDQSVSPIVSSSPCENPQLHFSVATQYQSGKVIAVGHEGILANNSISSNDNLAFISNAMAWLNPGNKRVAIKEGWIT
ncbi:MAG: hypothetical protein AB8H47_17180, partial [Bacteroidia bacterium]